MTSLSVESSSFKIDGGFTIARGSRTHATVVTVTLSKGTHKGIGECVPYARYGETVEGVMADIRAMASDLDAGLTRDQLRQTMAPGAARNALDCALWDLEAKTSGRPVYSLLGQGAPRVLQSAFTISVGTPEKMAADAAAARNRPLLKVKLAGDGDAARIKAVRQAAPKSDLIVDANEGWSADNLHENLQACEAAGVALIEQPLPAGNDAALETIATSVLICADESLHTSKELESLRDRYTAVNIKLDKTGGLTEAQHVLHKARELDYKVMVGCMLGTSLAMAPAFYLAQGADYVDLDGPLLLAEDRTPPIRFDGSAMHPPQTTLWG